MKKKYTVRLQIPTVMWALVEVEATCVEGAIAQAYVLNKEGRVDYEHGGYDNYDAEVVYVDGEPVRGG